ncbi:MAG: glycosyltransferase family 2 protein [Pseudomonadota bacterium]
MTDVPKLSVIIPANNEADHIETCLGAVLRQTGLGPGALEVIVAANGCTDNTADLARALAPRFGTMGWRFDVLDLPQGGKTGAVNAACAKARTQAQAFLDADIVIDPGLLAQVIDALSGSEPRYATGAMRVMRAKSWVSRYYGNVWVQLPFMQPGAAPGAGFFAVNAAGRARWDLLPDITNDDTYVRWLFAPQERVEVQAGFDWPLVEGFWDLVRVRRRQDRGNRELRALYPALEKNEQKPTAGLGLQFRLAVTMPISYLVYVAVKLAVRWQPKDESAWARGER